MSLGNFFDDTDKIKMQHERFRKCLEEMAKEELRKPEWYRYVAQIALVIPEN